MGTLQQKQTTPGEAAEKAANELGRFLKNEIDDTTERVASEAKAVAPSAVRLVLAGVSALAGLELVVLAPAVSHPIRSALFGTGLLGVAGYLAYGAYRNLPEDQRRSLVEKVPRLGALEGG